MKSGDEIESVSSSSSPTSSFSPLWKSRRFLFVKMIMECVSDTQIYSFLTPLIYSSASGPMEASVLRI